MGSLKVLANKCVPGVVQAEDKRQTLVYYFEMKYFTWNSDKNEKLIEERRISFEDVVVNIQAGNELDIFDHPNQQKYPG